MNSRHSGTYVKQALIGVRMFISVNGVSWQKLYQIVRLCFASRSGCCCELIHRFLNSIKCCARKWTTSYSMRMVWSFWFQAYPNVAKNDKFKTALKWWKNVLTKELNISILNIEKSFSLLLNRRLHRLQFGLWSMMQFKYCNLSRIAFPTTRHILYIVFGCWEMWW